MGTNALVQRLFWGLHNNERLVAMLKAKLTKQITHIRLPKLVEILTVRDLTIGPDLPVVTAGNVVSMSPSGELVLDCDFVYAGNFTVTFFAQTGVAIPLSKKRIKLQFLITVTVHSSSGKARVHFPSPYCKRAWLGFHTEPAVQSTIETQMIRGPFDVLSLPDSLMTQLRSLFLDQTVLPNMEDWPIYPSKKMKTHPSGTPAGAVPPLPPKTKQQTPPPLPKKSATEEAEKEKEMSEEPPPLPPKAFADSTKSTTPQHDKEHEARVLQEQGQRQQDDQEQQPKEPPALPPKASCNGDAALGTHPIEEMVQHPKELDVQQQQQQQESKHVHEPEHEPEERKHDYLEQEQEQEKRAYKPAVSSEVVLNGAAETEVRSAGGALSQHTEEQEAPEQQRLQDNEEREQLVLKKELEVGQQHEQDKEQEIEQEKRQEVEQEREIKRENEPEMEQGKEQKIEQEKGQEQVLQEDQEDREHMQECEHEKQQAQELQVQEQQKQLDGAGTTCKDVPAEPSSHEAGPVALKEELLGQQFEHNSSATDAAGETPECCTEEGAVVQPKEDAETPEGPPPALPPKCGQVPEDDESPPALPPKPKAEFVQSEEPMDEFACGDENAEEAPPLPAKPLWASCLGEHEEQRNEPAPRLTLQADGTWGFASEQAHNDEEAKEPVSDEPHSAPPLPPKTPRADLQ
eukprot:TRINITY_DN551_c0_g1_i3.p1 TRINITY_DN551_c0_g1~~TRINITY_DN551_c0_g1_i3.p1  ORF type:complete len:686 (+),score=208.89 TRINITY_DN551_c0_g1_i3:721-2778(+)